MAALETPSGVLANESELNVTIYIINTSHSELGTFYADMIESFESLVKCYIWNKDKLSLSQPKPLNDSVFVCHGTVDYGDNVEDEWFVVYVLFKLTIKYSDRLAIKTTDSDGQFMLIHAANQLPEWAANVDDEFMLNRVFIYAGDVYMIPPATTPAEVTYFPALGPIYDQVSALNTMTNFSSICRAPETVQQCIKARISGFEPDLITKKFLFHRATCLIPAKLAMLLKAKPGLIGTAINRFCEKDPKDLKMCRSLDIFKAEDIVSYRVLFTKHLYGKLKYCDFKPWPHVGVVDSAKAREEDVRREGCHKWPTQLEELKTMLGQVEVQNIDEKQLKERSLLGFKLTCAFEVLAKVILSNENVVEKASFENFIKKLTSLGYFKEHMEHSNTYNKLYEIAKANYIKPISNESEKSSESRRSEAINMLQSEISFESFTKLDGIGDYLEALRAEFSTSGDTDDSDEWLCVEAPALDDYLDMYSRGTNECTSAYNFRTLTTAFRRFIEQKPSSSTGVGTVSSASTTPLLPITVGSSISGSADFRPIDSRNEEKLIDIDTDLIQKNLKEGIALKNEDSENDSFYEIDDDDAAGVAAASSSDEGGRSSDKLKNYMDTMDEQLRDEANLSRGAANAKNDSSDEKQELDIDFNLVSNALESYSSQLGLTGPVSNILKSLGL